ncbi:MAG: tRNA (adenosine(37)-N6)-threonylcarbamoyltransferase complex transferase subunit TsaD [Candidatus Omnitrophica bacterium]|nr:tRNA (adenosine(37)-N6)-threonylcarbamoyltransferase complex transferase subunit TsaD [Candidatus Omnitrophota bacterium]
MNTTRILGIETSCDETAMAVVEDGQRILSNVVASSQQFHSRYGGVVPDIAARMHAEVISQVLEQALAEAGCAADELDAIAVTRGPGLPGALIVGLSFAKGLALSLDRPLIGVDHLAAHLYAGVLAQPDLSPPYVGLVASGGHTLVCVAHEEQRFELLGETKDDAVGEAFDKVAKLLGLGYPGGPAIDRISSKGNPAAIAFPRAHSKEALDFSFSGLKTAVYNHVQRRLVQGSRLKVEGEGLEPRTSNLEPQEVADIAASFQEAAVDMLIQRALRACQRTGLVSLVIGGGVAANRRLRERLTEAAAAKKIRVVIPSLELCVDNGAMVGGLGYELLRKGRVDPLSLTVDSTLCLNA